MENKVSYVQAEKFYKSISYTTRKMKLKKEDRIQKDGVAVNFHFSLVAEIQLIRAKLRVTLLFCIIWAIGSATAISYW